MFEPARARKDDPDTSKEAALRVKDQHIREAYDAVCRWPGNTTRELAKRMAPTDPATVADWLHKRLSDLYACGDIVKGAPRVCRETGYRACTWYPVERVAA